MPKELIERLELRRSYLLQEIGKLEIEITKEKDIEKEENEKLKKEEEKREIKEEGK